MNNFLAIASKRMVGPAPGEIVDYEISGPGELARVVIRFESEWRGWLLDAAADLELSAPLVAHVGEAVEVSVCRGAWWGALLPRGIRRGDTITMTFPGSKHALFVADFI